MEYIHFFNDQPENYLQFRPDYPENLYKFLLSLVHERDAAWDCGTGNGQAACHLASYFNRVIATDINEAQLNRGIKKNNIEYYCWPAEKTQIENASIDLITIAQALHWFDLPAFYAEVRRVAKPQAVISAWCYTLIDIDPNINRIIQKLYYDILGDRFWPKERKYIDTAYQTIPFPFKRIISPDFLIKKLINFPKLIGYLNTWSAVKKYEQSYQENPVQLIYAELEKAWDSKEKLAIWPLHLIAGYVHD